MTQELQEVIEAVSNINEDLYKQLPDDTKMVLTITTEPLNGYQQIEWLDQVIWNSEDDDRKWIEDIATGEDTNDKEPIEPYLRRRINELITNISKIKL